MENRPITHEESHEEDDSKKDKKKASKKLGKITVTPEKNKPAEKKRRFGLFGIEKPAEEAKPSEDQGTHEALKDKVEITEDDLSGSPEVPEVEAENVVAAEHQSENSELEIDLQASAALAEQVYAGEPPQVEPPFITPLPMQSWRAAAEQETQAPAEQPLPKKPKQPKKPRESFIKRTNDSFGDLILATAGYFSARKTRKAHKPETPKAEQSSQQLSQEVADLARQLSQKQAEVNTQSQAVNAAVEQDKQVVAEQTVVQVAGEQHSVAEKSVVEKPAKSEQPTAATTPEATLYSRQESPSVKAPAETTKPAHPKPELAPIKHEIAKSAETMNRQELLAVSGKIIVEGASLRQMYNANMITEKGLRRLVKEHLRGGNLPKALKREIKQRQIDFERDPNQRDQNGAKKGTAYSTVDTTTNKPNKQPTNASIGKAAANDTFAVIVGVVGLAVKGLSSLAANAPFSKRKLDGIELLLIAVIVVLTIVVGTLLIAG